MTSLIKPSNNYTVNAFNRNRLVEAEEAGEMVRKSVVRKLNNMVLNISESVIPFPIE